METLRPSFFSAEFLEGAELLRVCGISPSMKHLGVMVEMGNGDYIFDALYRPEAGVTLTLDPRVPKPQELYRDVAYHRVDRLLGWGGISTSHTLVYG